MIVVNSSGTDAVYRQLDHSPWNGCTFADWVFPSFLVVVGLSLTLSLRRRVEGGEDRGGLLRQIFRRAAIIVALGLVENAVFYASGSLPIFRYYGVLQRIGVCYLLAALLFLETTWRAQAAAAGALLAGYWALLTRAPVPGFGPPDLSIQGNLASWLDRALFAGHLYRPMFDPEGGLSTLPSLATTLIGAVAGRWLASRRGQARKALGLILGGAILAALGWVWSVYFPFNKHLWTSSFALWTAGLSLAGFGLCYGLVEIRGATAWGRPFEWFGRNALAAYFLSGLVYGAQEFIQLSVNGRTVSLKIWLTHHLFSHWLAPPNASLAYALAFTAACWALMYALHRKKWFLKI